MSELLCAQVLAAFQRCQRDGASAPAVDSTVGPWDELAVSPYQNPDGNLQCGQEGDSGGPILLHPSAGIWLQLATVSASDGGDSCDGNWAGFGAEVDAYQSAVSQNEDQKVA
jgi:hypothetical protein